jgi:hypothetical protein
MPKAMMALLAGSALLANFDGHTNTAQHQRGLMLALAAQRILYRTGSLAEIRGDPQVVTAQSQRFAPTIARSKHRPMPKDELIVQTLA